MNYQTIRPLTQTQLEETFKLYTTGKNWKESHTVEFENLTGKSINNIFIEHDAQKVQQAFIHFTGGAEIQRISESKIIVSTKGYYHYIGA